MSKKILIVDDEPDAVKAIAYVLSKEGYTVVTANDGEGGVEKVKQERPGLVLLDIMMPGIDGFETLKRIKRIDKEIPVAMVTAVWDQEEYEKCLSAGAYEYVTKPIDFERLKTAVLVKMFGEK